VLLTRRGIGTFVVEPAEPARNEQARQAELRAVAMRALADASARGFSAADLRRELNAISKGVT
jgi:DNA-binding transcriptional regulator YhcF (GntR family)